jgi:polar amino acid transport system permease protein
LIAIVLATAIGLIVAVLRAAHIRPVAAILGAYVEVFRNTPLLVQFLFWYFGAARLLPRSWLDWMNLPHAWQLGSVTTAWPGFEFFAAAFGLTLFTAAFIAEDIRSGIKAVPKGQYESATSQGLTHWQAMRRVILPQALRHARGPIIGEYLNVVKNSSLAMAIGLAELSYQSREIETETFHAFEAFAAATVLYIGLSMGLTLLNELIKIQSKHRRFQTVGERA